MAQPYDKMMGAGTFHPATFLRAIGPEPWSSVYVQPSRRPTDGRYADSPNRMGHFYQMQVLLKPAPVDIQQRYLQSLAVLGIDPLQDDIRFVEDDWKSPTLGAWGLGWEVWQNGMEISQFTYFQQMGGLACAPVSGELTYGLERIAMSIQRVDDVYDLVWGESNGQCIRYGELFKQREIEMSGYDFLEADVAVLRQHFDDCERVCLALLENDRVWPAYEKLLEASHAFNVLDARGTVSVTERQRFILRVRQLARRIAQAYYDARKALGFPLLKQGASLPDSNTPNTPNMPNVEGTHVRG